MIRRALVRRFARAQFAPRNAMTRVRVGDDGDVSIPDPSDADLEAAGLDPALLQQAGSTRTQIVQAYNDARNAMNRAGQMATAKQVGATLTFAAAAVLPFFPPASLALGALAAFWTGSLAALNAIGNALGWAKAGLGVWTEWLNQFPPQGTGVADGDANWFNPATGYKPGAHTPWTVRDSNWLGAGGDPPIFGSIDTRIARADIAGTAAGTFARFVLPIVYRTWELAMNGRLRDEKGYGLFPGDMLQDPYNPSAPGYGVKAFDSALALYNSQHAGPAVSVPGDDFPFAPPSFLLNVGPMTGTLARLISPLRLSSSPTLHLAPSQSFGAQHAAAAIAAALPWLRRYGIVH